MHNILDYIKWRGDLLMEKVPFCDVDALILSQLSYTRLTGIVAEGPGGAPVTIEEAGKLVLTEPNRLKQDEDEDLWNLIMKSDRFRDLVLTCHIDRFDIATEKQFSALTVLIPEGKAAVVYRGTDLTIVGWKEDFNMSFADVVPAQKDAVDYFNKVAEGLPDREFYLCGHSKGGNLAVYGGAFCESELQKRILQIRNFDGPGFSQENVEKPGMKDILPKTRTFLPQSSVVGMLLEHEEEFTVIHSRSIGLMQHDLYTWEIMGAGFVVEEETTDSSKFIDRALKQWLQNMPKEKREAFVETVFSILDDCDAVTLKELFSKRNALTVMKNLTAMEAEDRELIQEGMSILSHSVRKTLPLPNLPIKSGLFDRQKDEGTKDENL
ncbi:MAG: DUF2974 domain-containing protein [Firmicutes bacterium]|nr:DUF2974 domain-containing protein [Bacillota bacterium]